MITQTSTEQRKRVSRIITSLNHAKKRMSQALEQPPLEESQRAMLREWQLNRMLKTHRALLESADYRAGVRYLLEDLYSCNPNTLAPVADQIEKMLPVAARLFPAKILETAAIAIDLHLMTDEIDATLYHTLFNELGHTQITSENYRLAYQQSGVHHARLTQLQLAIGLTASVEKHLNKRWVYRAFCFSKRPAFAAHLNDLYRFMHKAFEMIRLTPNLSQVVAQIAERERAISLDLSLDCDPILHASLHK